jgi:hypothetical protein
MVRNTAKIKRFPGLIIVFANQSITTTCYIRGSRVSDV